MVTNFQVLGATTAVCIATTVRSNRTRLVHVIGLTVLITQ